MKVYDGTEGDEPGRSEPDRLKVGIAEYEVTTQGATLTTSGLGSCIGLALHDPDAGVAGLVHVMLPKAAEATGGAPAKFADTGTDRLVEEMVAAGASERRMAAKLAGGSDMLNFSDGSEGIGQRNAAAVRARLDDHGIPVVGEDVGGDHGRSLRFEGETGDLEVRTASRESRTL